MRSRLTWLIAALLSLSAVKPAFACKCGFRTERELNEHYVVFVGKPLEYAEREATGSTPPRRENRLYAATRFEVGYSRDLAPGSSVIVMTDPHSDCSAWYGLGQSQLVVALRVGELLTGSKCSTWFRDDGLEARLLKSLGVPENFFKHAPRLDKALPPERCRQPTTLDAAFASADAVLWSSRLAGCVIPGSDAIESVSVARWAWKGAAPGDVFHLRVDGDPEVAFDDFDFSDQLYEATKLTWPVAEFLRRDGELFVNDGCLTPQAPASLAAGKEALLRLFPFPENYRPNRSSRWPVPVPRLSCGSIDASLFARADQAFERYRQAQDQESTGESARAPQATPAHSGSCAGCAVAARATDAWFALALGVAAASVRVTLLRRRRRRRAECGASRGRARVRGRVRPAE